VFKKRQIFLKHNLELFLELFAWKPIRNRRSPHDILSLKTISPNTRTNNLFSKKKPKSCKISKTYCFKLTSKQFLFSKWKIKISRFILDKYFFTKLKKKKKEMREWSLKTIIFMSRRQSTPRGNGQYKEATLCSEGISILFRKKKRRERNISYKKTKGHFGLQNAAWSFQ